MLVSPASHRQVKPLVKYFVVIYLNAITLDIPHFFLVFFSSPLSRPWLLEVPVLLFLDLQTKFPEGCQNLQSSCISCYLQVVWLTALALEKPARVCRQWASANGDRSNLEYHPRIAPGEFTQTDPFLVQLGITILIIPDNRPFNIAVVEKEKSECHWGINF